jgi:peptidoglycan/LPS O-acetylase OafA/YrhL
MSRYMAKAALAITGPTGIGTADSHLIRYRPDIDGLRAVAVWFVVVFHVSRTLAPAGYLGVDMFFVISGYLITSIIWREITTGKFKFSTFYDRRIRRIMPALLVLLAVITAVAIAIKLPADLIGFGRSMLASLTFLPNIYFWRDTDYFSRSAETKPLLHLWSLGIEEQFYIFFPLLLWLVARLNRRAIVPCVALVVFGSLTADIVLRRAGGEGPAFYLLPTRGWELGVGAFVALLADEFSVRGRLAQITSLVGAALTVTGLFGGMRFGGILPEASSVVFGTGLMIFAGRHSYPAPSRVLAVRPLVFFGWISYSLYLWHWPILVLSRYYLVRDLDLRETLVAIATMVAVAIASWWIVERPFRDSRMPITRVRLTAAIGATGLGLIAAGLIITHGLPQRLDPAAAVINEAVDTHYRCSVADMLPFGSSRACVMNLPSRNPADADVVLLGNSHAQMYAPLWREIVAERDQTGLLVPLNGCLPTVTMNSYLECFPAARQNLKAVLALPRAKVVVLGLTWSYGPKALFDSDGLILDNRGDMALANGLDDLIDRLEAAGKQVALIGPIAEPGYDIASDLSRSMAFQRPMTGPTAASIQDFRRQFGLIISHFENRKDIVFIRPDAVQCDAIACHYLIGGRSIFSDSNHISALALPLFKPLFEAAYQKQRRVSAPNSGLRPALPDGSASSGSHP